MADSLKARDWPGLNKCLYRVLKAVARNGRLIEEAKLPKPITGSVVMLDRPWADGSVKQLAAECNDLIQS